MRHIINTRKCKEIYIYFRLPGIIKQCCNIVMLNALKEIKGILKNKNKNKKTAKNYKVKYNKI